MKTKDMNNYGTYMYPDLLKALKLHAIEYGLKDYEVINAAIEDYLKRSSKVDSNIS